MVHTAAWLGSIQAGTPRLGIVQTATSWCIKQRSLAPYKQGHQKQQGLQEPAALAESTGLTWQFQAHRGLMAQHSMMTSLKTAGSGTMPSKPLTLAHLHSHMLPCQIQKD